MGKIYTDSDGNRIERVSKWIKIRSLPVTKRHALWDYATDGSGYHPYQNRFNPENGVFLDYFRFEGKQYALEQFLSTSSTFMGAYNPYYTANNVDDYVILSGYEADEYFHPLLIELDECGEYVRLYKELPR